MKKRLTTKQVDDLVECIKLENPESGLCYHVNNRKVTPPVEVWVADFQAWVRYDGSVVVISGKGYHYPRLFQRMRIRKVLRRYYPYDPMQD